MHPKKSLTEWLDHLNKLHPTEIDLGLDRIKIIANKLNVTPACPVITVAGTNGKGSCVAGLESIYHAARYRVGAFTSPILFSYHDYVRIEGEHPSDEDFCEAFEKIEAVRGTVSLTFFEFTALAAFLIFQKNNLDVWILEVGLGGRLDAVNIIDADVAVISTIALDHQDRLGNTREKIALEKAGIMRAGKPAVCGDMDPPITLLDYAKKTNVNLFLQQHQFHFTNEKNVWHWQSNRVHYQQLPMPTLALQNMSTVLMAIELLQTTLPVSEENIREGLSTVKLPGRIEIIPGEITHIFDVSHNPAACQHLAQQLKQHHCQGKTIAIFSMLQDKDIVASIAEIKSSIDVWHIAALPVPRGASLAQLQKAFDAHAIPVHAHETLEKAYETAYKNAMPGDRILVFGSFHTVACIMRKARACIST